MPDLVTLAAALRHLISAINEPDWWDPVYGHRAQSVSRHDHPALAAVLADILPGIGYARVVDGARRRVVDIGPYGYYLTPVLISRTPLRDPTGRANTSRFPADRVAADRGIHASRRL